MFGSKQLWDFPHLSAGSHGRSKATSIHEQQGLRLCGLHAKRVTLWSVQSRVTKPGPGLLTSEAAQEKAGLEAHVEWLQPGCWEFGHETKSSPRRDRTGTRDSFVEVGGESLGERRGCGARGWGRDAPSLTSLGLLPAMSSCCPLPGPWPVLGEQTGLSPSPRGQAST